MRMLAFASRNRKELIRDPLSLVFGIGLPIFLLLIMTALQRNVSIAVFSLTNFTPGIAIFSFSFISLFTGMLIARDLSTSFLTRLFASPLTAADYIAGYSLPLLPIALVQSMLCFATAAALGLKLDGNIFWTLLTLVPAALLFIAFGLLLGTLFNDRSVGGITSILIQVVAFTSACGSTWVWSAARLKPWDMRCPSRTPWMRRARRWPATWPRSAGTCCGCWPTRS